MDELVRWLGEQLDDDERIAKAASAGPWAKRVGYISGGPDGRVRVAQQAQAWNADHITAHDPARVLREIDAKRQLLALHTPFRVDGDPWPGCNTCSWRDEMEDLQVQWPCPTLRLLALPYADRPGYREKWRP